MLFDTHCHLNFKRFHKNIDDVITEAKEKGVKKMVVPGTDLASSLRATELAKEYEGIYAAVGLHPHHVFDLLDKQLDWESELSKLMPLYDEDKVVAVGETGLDNHIYEQTKYEAYEVSKEFLGLQQKVFLKQIEIAAQKGLSLIIHNREATDDLLRLLDEHWDQRLEGRMVFHCCEADNRLLTFAQERKIFIGVDGDLSYSTEKQEFIRNVPIDMLVLETDSPFLLPEPMRSRKEYPNKPQHVQVIMAWVARLKEVSEGYVAQRCWVNSLQLFGLKD